MGSLWHPEAALFCLAWVGLAVAAYILEGFLAGSLLTFGFMAVMMPVSGYLIGKRDDVVLERTIRWSLLILAGVILALVHTLGG
jgi:hypothetical protein